MKRTLILGDPFAETIVTADDINWGFRDLDAITAREAASAQAAHEALENYRRENVIPFTRRRGRDYKPNARGSRT